MADTVTTILFLAANPLDTDPLRLGEELRDIKASLRQATHRDRFVTQDEWAVRIDDLRRALLRYKDAPLILHFAGHGDSSAIVLEGKDGQPKPVEGSALSRFLKLFPNIRCVILNACYSETVAEALAEVVPCVVGMEAEVTDAYAVSFAVAFYDAIGEGLDYVEAFAVAESSLDMEGGLEEVRPVFKPGKVIAPAQFPQAAAPRLVAPSLASIIGRQQGEFADALVDAFGSKEALARMVKVALGKNLDAIAGGANLGALTFNLVDWAARSGYLHELLQGALDAQPRNRKLHAFALSVGAQEAQTVPASPAQAAPPRSSDHYRDVLHNFLAPLEEYLAYTYTVFNDLRAETGIEHLEFDPEGLKRIYSVVLPKHDVRRITWIKTIEQLQAENQKIVALIEKNYGNMVMPEFRKACQEFKHHANQWAAFWQAVQETGIDTPREVYEGLVSTPFPRDFPDALNREYAEVQRRALGND